jgi:hypothetical protein
VTWIGSETDRGKAGPGFVIESRGIGQRRRAVLLARRRDGTLTGPLFPAHPNFGLVKRLQREWEDRLRAGDPEALELVDVSAGELRGPDR